MSKRQYIVRFDDGTYYRDRNRTPRHFIHNATKMSSIKADRIANAQGGVVVEVNNGPVALGQ